MDRNDLLWSNDRCDERGRKKEMIKVIGTGNCGECIRTRKKLDSKGIEYTYTQFSDLNMEEVNELRKKGCRSMPILLKDDKLCGLEDIING